MVTALVGKVNGAPGFKEAGQVNEAIKNPRRFTSDAGGTVVAAAAVEVDEDVVEASGAVDLVVGTVAVGGEEQAANSSPAEQVAAASSFPRFQGT